MFSAARRWLIGREIGEDARAVGCAIGLCLFLWVLKIHLGWWYVSSRGIEALDGLGVFDVLLLGGGDVVLCGVVAAVYGALFLCGTLLPRSGRLVVAGVLPAALHAGLVVFSTVSWQVHQIYSFPLEIGHLRAADNLATAWSSIVPYLGFLQISTMVVGLASYPLGWWGIARLVARVRWLGMRWRLWAVTLTGAAVIGGLWVVRLRGVYVCGLKRNAVIHFVQYYTWPAKGTDVVAAARRLSADMRGRESELLRPASVRLGGVKLSSDVKCEGSGEGLNVLMVVMESTSAAYVDERTTPNLMRLSETGVSFRDHYIVFSETYKAIYGLLYSDYLPELGGRVRDLYKRPLPQKSLADVLKSRGYRTAFFHSGYLSYADLDYAVGPFDVKADAVAIQTGAKPWAWGMYEEQTVAALSKWISQNKGQRFFAVYSTIFPHHPYASPLKDAPFARDTWEHRYRDSLYYADRNVGALIDALEKDGLREETLIVVVGDHGETVTEKIQTHGVAMTLAELRPPFILSNPKLFPGKQESRLSTCHLDVAPTVAKLVGAEAAEEWLGRDVLSEYVPARMQLIRMDQGKMTAIVDNGVLFVWDEKTGQSRLYEIADDRLKAVTGRLDPYQEMAKAFVPWAIWRHLQRATGSDAQKR